GAPGAKLRAVYELRYSGQAFELSVAGATEPDPAELRRAFDAAHAERYGYHNPDADLELVSIRVAVAEPGAEPPAGAQRPAESRGTRRARFDAEQLDAAVLAAGGGELSGPAIVELPGATLLVPPGWRAEGGAESVTMERVH
ncbi:MAG TPA: hypothetical protein VEQ61_10275, partial [Thermoleophilaceae bacterium]|nr:hypothetical protein [Thermoleophilaceae bacterium]